MKLIAKYSKLYR